MSKLFQNGPESEIVAGYFNGESLEGLYLNSDYFKILKKYTFYYGRLISNINDWSEGMFDMEEAEQIFGTSTDEQFIEEITGENSTSIVSKNTPFSDKQVVDGVETGKDIITINYSSISTSKITVDFFAFPKKFVIAEKPITVSDVSFPTINLNANDSYRIREVTIDGEDYVVYYGLSDSKSAHGMIFKQ